MCDLGS